MKKAKHSSTQVKTTPLYKTHLKNINALCNRTLHSLSKRPRAAVGSQRVCVHLEQDGDGMCGARLSASSMAWCAGDRQGTVTGSEPNISHRSQAPGKPSPEDAQLWKPPLSLHPPSDSEAQMPRS